MGFLDLFGKRDSGAIVRGVPYSVKLRFLPYRLLVKSGESVGLFIDLKNITKEKLLTSVVVELPEELGFDRTCFAHTRETRLGYVGPDEEKTVRVELWGSHKTKQGEYEILVTVFCHYRDYAHVLNYVKKNAVLRVE